MKRFVLCLAIPALGACSLLSKRAEESESARRDRMDVEAIAKTREGQGAENALVVARRFIVIRPDSSYLQAARLEEARALEDLGRPLEAKAIDLDVRERTLSEKPELSGMAEWRLSFIEEALGDEVKALAHVLGAENKREFLPESIARAELPARKAQLYHRLGRDEDARVAVAEAERGLRALLSGPRAKPDDAWMARLYLEMGRSLVGAVEPENFSPVLKAQRVSQVYLLKSIAVGDPKNSPMALDLLRSNYMNLWAAIQNVSSEAGDVDGGGRRRRQVPMAVDLLNVLDEAARLRPSVGAGNEWEKQAQGDIDELSRKTRAILYANAETTVLTEESRVLNGIRREGLKLIPIEEPKKKSNDPNL